MHLGGCDFNMSLSACSFPVMIYDGELISKVGQIPDSSILYNLINFLFTLLQNKFVVSAGKVSLVSALQADTIYTIRKRRSF
jgi:hypothetical protein